MSPWDAKPATQQKQEPRKSAPRIYIKFAKHSKFANRFKVDNFRYKNWNDWFKQKIIHFGKWKSETLKFTRVSDFKY